MSRLYGTESKQTGRPMKISEGSQKLASGDHGEQKKNQLNARFILASVWCGRRDLSPRTITYFH
jgi:hypothetical protein